ncbi:hypothetical protein BCIN_04g00080 [Botrytis cinerea B05.10]|uniref:2EXR domain-containing protein n=1 Tax=Botryotinia fuckeliana (strain B05.10) TaxID=332648 RepID=A0A384JEP1_BOTFB|nr:hypothetical protein BCIN_04g00080 [Botrytis cinerea B05.10]ATZ48774.1 hypothetical protein BCIN_04g00080 [Botrytis cinerea B05.10]
MASFPQFALLPTELRLHIWYFALEGQQGHIVPVESLRYGRPRKFKPHALYFVNRDSRRTYLGYHKSNLARYPRLGIVVFDPRIDIVLVEVSWVKWIKNALTQIGDRPEGRVMKDVRNIAIAAIYEDSLSHGGLQTLPNSIGNTIARVLPSLENFIYDFGYDSRNPHFGRLCKASQEIGYEQGSHTYMQRQDGRREELLIQPTRELLEEYKRSENPKWSIPRVLSTHDIYRERIDVRRLLAEG